MPKFNPLDATITMLRRTQNQGVAFTVEYDDAAGKHAVNGKSSVLWSSLIPHGFDVATASDGDHKVSIPCEFDGRRITNVPLSRPMIDATPAPRPMGRIAVHVGARPPKKAHPVVWLFAAMALVVVATMLLRNSAHHS